MRRWPLAEFLLVVAVALVCLGFQLWLPSTHVDEKDYQEVARVLASEAQPGDAVLLAPWWTERARLYLPPQVEVVGYQGSDDADLEQHPRVWVLAEPRLPRADYDGFYRRFAPGRTALGPIRRFGNLRLQLFSNGRAKPVRFSLGPLLAQADVYVEAPGGQRTECPWDGRAHRCPGGYVAEEWREVLFQPRRCIRFFPPGGPSKLVLEAQVPAADELGLRTGMAWDRGFFHHAGLTSTRVELSVDGQPAATVDLPPGQQGLQKVKGPPVHDGARVRLTSESANPELRELCVELYGFGAGGAR